jgi:hypothetical protein
MQGHTEYKEIFLQLVAPKFLRIMHGNGRSMKFVFSLFLRELTARYDYSLPHGFVS